MAHENARLPLPQPLPRPQPVQPPFTPSDPPTTAPSLMAFTAHASRARNIGVMNPMNLYFRNIMTEDLQVKIMNAALAQVKRWSLPVPIEIRQYHWPIAGLAQRCHPERRQWTTDWVEKHTLPGCRLADLLVKVKPVPVWSIKGFPDAETHDPLNAGAEYFEPYEDEPRTEAEGSGPEGDDFEMDMGVYELYEIMSLSLRRINLRWMWRRMSRRRSSLIEMLFQWW
ncbi:hypothetical protein E4U57_006801 [Claviceps arundinis]|uniref:Uncharacterized protein n=1 Tax=Claviceps arundinis TaxID=1623583 RepID=A0ABQ7P1I7_9HYPO|nr:hypothetical protein E4U57_006801 [Claviceps arundinis]